MRRPTSGKPGKPRSSASKGGPPRKGGRSTARADKAGRTEASGRGDNAGRSRFGAPKPERRRDGEDRRADRAFGGPRDGAARDQQSRPPAGRSRDRKEWGHRASNPPPPPEHDTDYDYNVDDDALPIETSPVGPGAESAATSGVETLEVSADEDGLRLDRWFRVRFPEVTNSYLQKLARTGQVRVESKRCEANTRLEAGQQIRVPKTIRVPAVRMPGARTGVKPPLGMSKADRDFIEAMILYEDEAVLVLNKPFGIAVQGGAGNRRNLDSLLAGMVDRFGDRPRLVHRLDRDTTGVILIAKSRNAAAKLGRVFQTRSAAKTYWALVKGVPKPNQGKVEAALVKASGPDGDRVRKAQPGEQDRAMHATTHYSTIDRVAHKCAWVSLKPVTGRQHQLRAHMDLIGCQIVGDNKYEGGMVLPSEDIEPKLHLHARRLVIPHPEGGQIDVTAPLPDHMLRTWKLLGLDPDRFDAGD